MANSNLHLNSDGVQMISVPYSDFVVLLHEIRQHGLKAQSAACVLLRLYPETDAKGDIIDGNDDIHFLCRCIADWAGEVYTESLQLMGKAGLKP